MRYNSTKALKAIGLTDEKGRRLKRIHDCRHTYVSQMAIADVPISYIARQIGDTEDVVKAVYKFWIPDAVEPKVLMSAEVLAT